MTLSPRAVVVSRPTEYELLMERHGTRQQVAFFLEQRGRDLEKVDTRHDEQQSAMQTVTAALPLDWRRAMVDRADLDRWLFAPEDIVVAVGQDGLVANVAKYLDGQLVVGVNPSGSANAGVLVNLHPAQVAAVFAKLAAGEDVPVSSRAWFAS